MVSHDDDSTLRGGPQSLPPSGSKPRYVQELRIARGACTLTELDEMVEAVRQYAFPELLTNEADRLMIEKLRVTVEADDLWEVREQCEMVKEELDAYQHALVDRFEIDRKHLTSTS